MIKLNLRNLEIDRSKCDCHRTILWKSRYKGFFGRVKEGEPYDQFTIGYKKYPREGYENIPPTFMLAITIYKWVLKFTYVKDRIPDRSL